MSQNIPNLPPPGVPSGPPQIPMPQPAPLQGYNVQIADVAGMVDAKGTPIPKVLILILHHPGAMTVDTIVPDDAERLGRALYELASQARSKLTLPPPSSNGGIIRPGG